MRPMTESLKTLTRVTALLAVLLALAPAASVFAQQPGLAAPATATAERAGGEANLVLPDLTLVDVGGYNGRTLLLFGLLVCAGGLVFGVGILNQLKNLPVHRSMRE